MTQLAKISTFGYVGIQALLVDVEVHISQGLPSFSIVGLPENAVKESKDRVRSALINSGFSFPNRRITVNLAPADLPKQGGGFDLPIALGILIASKQLEADTSDYTFAAELALSGKTRASASILPMAVASKKIGRTLITSVEVHNTLAPFAGLKVQLASNLIDICHMLNGSSVLETYTHQAIKDMQYHLDMQDIKGQHQARRALEVAAAGRHNIMMVGAPGSGKTMLAMRLPTILPLLHEDDALESALIYSVAQKKYVGNALLPPFRSPHHSASSAALVGGGTRPQPGEISLAHNGILFLDEIVEFKPSVLEVLREPLESGEIVISRANYKVSYPADFQVIAAMNPPEFNSNKKRQLSAPFLDRIDIHLYIKPVPPEVLSKRCVMEDSTTIYQRVLAARAIQQQRGCLNSRLQGKDLEDICKINQEEWNYLQSSADKLKMSARAIHRTMRLARTIADLASSDKVQREHLTEAVSYRR